MPNRQPYQFPATSGPTLTDIIPIQEDAGGVVEKMTLQQLITFLQSSGGGAGNLIFDTMADLKANTVLLHKKIVYFTIGDPNIFEDAAKYYYDENSTDPDNGRSILIPDSINPVDPGRYIQFITG